MATDAPEATLTILVVDDEQVVCRTLGRLLERVGYGVLCAVHPQAALELFQEHHIDIVLSDIRMPELSGVDLCWALRSRRPVPVVLMTVML